MALQPFRCISAACLLKAGNHNGTEFYSEPKGQTDELKKMPATACPNCGNEGPDRLVRLQLIHLLIPTPPGQKPDHTGVKDNWSYACERARKAKMFKQLTAEPSAATCPDCKEYIASLPPSSDEE